MRNAEESALLENCRAISVSWSGQQFTNFLRYLEAGLLRGALAAADESDQLTLFRHHKRMEHSREQLTQAFCLSLETSLRANPKTGITDNSNPALIQLSQLFKECCGYRGIGFCQQLQNDNFIAHCRNSLQHCGFEPIAEAFALGLFHEYFLATLPDLYAQLNSTLLEQLMSSASNTGLDDWIRHLEVLLSNRNLDAARRSMAQARLEELQQQRQQLTKSQSALPKLSIAERWYTPYPELNTPASRKRSDSELTEEAKRLFKPLFDNDKLPREVRNFTNRMYPLLVEAALEERELFLSPLHPYRQLINHMIATTKHWDQSAPEEQIQMLDTLRKLAHSNLQAFSQNPTLHQRLVESVDHYCDEAMTRISQSTDPETSTEVMRTQVHQLLRKKMAGETYPPLVDKLLLGPWTRVIVYHWQQGHANSQQLKEAVSVAELVLGYCDTNRPWTQSQKQHLETLLKEGLASVDMERHQVQQLIIGLHKLRLHLEKQSRGENKNRRQSH